MLVLFFFFFFSWLGSCQLGLKVFHWERKFCLLVSAVFSILEVYIYLNSVLLVFFCFRFRFLFPFFPRGQAWVVDFRNRSLARLLSQKRPFVFRELCYEDTLRTFPSEGHFSWPSTEAVPTLEHFLNGQCSARYPCLIRLHTRLPHMKRKEKFFEKNL